MPAQNLPLIALLVGAVLFASELGLIARSWWDGWQLRRAIAQRGSYLPASWDPKTVERLRGGLLDGRARRAMDRRAPRNPGA